VPCIFSPRDPDPFEGCEDDAIMSKRIGKSLVVNGIHAGHASAWNAELDAKHEKLVEVAEERARVTGGSSDPAQ
jgi:hypothetical protein